MYLHFIFIIFFSIRFLFPFAQSSYLSQHSFNNRIGYSLTVLSMALSFYFFSSTAFILKLS